MPCGFTSGPAKVLDEEIPAGRHQPGGERSPSGLKVSDRSYREREVLSGVRCAAIQLRNYKDGGARRGSGGHEGGIRKLGTLVLVAFLRVQDEHHTGRGREDISDQQG